MVNSEQNPVSVIDDNARVKVRIRKLCKAFGEKKVLDELDLDVVEGESLVIIGGSGTGKSVLNKCILGLHLADSGSIMIDGEDLCKVHAIKRDKWMRKIGVLFQGSALFDSLPVWQNVAFSWLHSSKNSSQIFDAAVETLESVGLDSNTAKLMPAELSGGMQRRVAFARTIFEQPKLIFFDEPTTGLDPVMSEVINRLIRDSVTKLHATAITITHDMNSAKKIGDRVAMLANGRICWAGGPSDLDNCSNETVSNFVQGISN